MKQSRLSSTVTGDWSAGHVPTITTMLLALVDPPEEQSRLPSIEETLSLGEVVHQAIIRRAARGSRIDCPELTGHEANGQPLQRPHLHAYLLPTDLDGDRVLDHVIVHARMGLGGLAQSAIRSLRWLSSRRKEMAPISARQFRDLRVRVAQTWCAADGMAALSGPVANLWRQLTPSLGSCCWESLTPFVPPRYLKRNRRHDLPGQVHAELVSRGLPAPVRVEILANRSQEMKSFARVRRLGGRPPPQDCGFALRLHLAQPAMGPIALGYASHFGLGLFAAVGQ